MYVCECDLLIPKAELCGAQCSNPKVRQVAVFYHLKS